MADNYPSRLIDAPDLNGVSQTNSRLGEFFAWLDNKKRVFGRNMMDLVNDPKNALLNASENAQETILEYLSDPINFVGHGVGGVAGTFIGKNAKTWNAAEHTRALKMSAEGVDPRVIWKETGNWKGPDGNWRQEISDNAAKLRFDFDSLPRYKNTYLNKQVDMPIGGVLDHPELYRAYPEMLRKIRIDEIQKQPAWIPDSLKSGEYRQSYHPSLPAKISVRAKTDADARSMLGHEIQHDIQQSREMWSKGGSESSMGSFDDYRKLAGEAEARATEARFEMDAAKRREIFPEDSYDIPLDQLIFRR